MKKDAIQILENAGTKVTPNRILVVKELLASESPKSLIELEIKIGTMDRSSILRVLNVLTESGIVHIMEDGRGISKYEICQNEGHCSVGDMHAHFYCEKCKRMFCLDDITAPKINISGSFIVKSVNFMIKGICSECNNSLQHE